MGAGLTVGKQCASEIGQVVTGRIELEYRHSTLICSILIVCYSEASADHPLTPITTTPLGLVYLYSHLGQVTLR